MHVYFCSVCLGAVSNIYPIIVVSKKCFAMNFKLPVGYIRAVVQERSMRPQKTWSQSKITC